MGPPRHLKSGVLGVIHHYAPAAAVCQKRHFTSLSYNGETMSRMPQAAATTTVAPASAPVPSPKLTDPAFYLNRELSWLDFNRRVLALAEDPSIPLLERVKFLAIVGTNLNEFFMIRMASLLRKQRTGTEDVSPDGMNTEEQLVRARRQATEMLALQAKCWTKELRPQL